MSRFLPLNRSGSTIAIGICDRCRRKVQLSELRPDGNSPGLMVCKHEGCWDELDRWRLPARQTEIISLRKPRPDTIPSVVSPIVWVDNQLLPVVWINNDNDIVDWTN